MKKAISLIVLQLFLVSLMAQKNLPVYLDDTQPIENRIEDALSRMTLEEKVKKYSETIYKKLGCKGVVRIDFILNPLNEPLFLEINTIPGQTAMSIVPRQLTYNNIPLPEFYAGLIYDCTK